MYYTVLAAITSHSGYADLVVKGKPALELGNFFHQLHRRYFDCNYGNPHVPLDKWLGSFHDGSPEATARLRQRQLKLRRSSGGKKLS